MYSVCFKWIVGSEAEGLLGLQLIQLVFHHGG